MSKMLSWLWWTNEGRQKYCPSWNNITQFLPKGNQMENYVYFCSYKSSVSWYLVITTAKHLLWTPSQTLHNTFPGIFHFGNSIGPRQNISMVHQRLKKLLTFFSAISRRLKWVPICILGLQVLLLRPRCQNRSVFLKRGWFLDSTQQGYESYFKKPFCQQRKRSLESPIKKCFAALPENCTLLQKTRSQIERDVQFTLKLAQYRHITHQNN